MKRPVITLLTDFGHTDHYAAAMKGVMLGICPNAQLVDISHEIPPYAITEAAFTLAQAWRYFPKPQPLKPEPAPTCRPAPP